MSAPPAKRLRELLRITRLLRDLIDELLDSLSGQLEALGTLSEAVPRNRKRHWDRLRP